MWWTILTYTWTQHYVYSSQRILFLGLLDSWRMDPQSVSKRVNYQHMLHNIPHVWSPHTKHYLEISSHWMDDSFRCAVLPFPPLLLLQQSALASLPLENTTSLTHGDINEINTPRRIHGNAAPRDTTCFLWHVASGLANCG